MEIASAEERQWLDYLVRVDYSDAEEGPKKVFQTMIRVIQVRQKDSR